MIKIGMIGIGKMGISHYAVFNAHKDAEVVAACDPSAFLLAVFEKNNGVKCYNDYKEMIDREDLDCVVISTPTKFHAEIVRYALERKLHVFCEKPFCLNSDEGEELVKLAEERNLVNQVGYHCRFAGVFQKTKDLLDKSVIGDIYYFKMEVYGNVVKKKQSKTWRSKKSEGGGCLYDYASHGVDLVNYLLGLPKMVTGTVIKRINSTEIDDAVYSTFVYDKDLTGYLAINWCDASFRKMSNQITIMGTKGKIIADRQECKVFLNSSEDSTEMEKGWNIFYTTDVTNPVDFYLRGEEYSLQVDYFIQGVKEKRSHNISSFKCALQTDILIDMLAKDGKERG